MPRYYIYCRKSSESEDRQVLSIESQTNELNNLAKRFNLTVLDVLTESKSAKSPGRPIFNEMIKNIQQGKADGIVCWKLDRLARNPIDGGQIVWMLQRGIIKHIQTFDRGYYPEDNVLVMNIEFGMANQYILDLSKNVKRGLKTKVEKGWMPTKAPVGYLNKKSKKEGISVIAKDPERFELVKKLWGMMLIGSYAPMALLRIARDDWGLRTKHGKSFSRSTAYKVFTNPFYYGYFEYPKGSGNWYQGAHEPMITANEYDKVQTLLGRKGRPRPKKYQFAYKEHIRCGECGGSITAEGKNQIICSSCKYKFSSNNKVACPKCNTFIEKMRAPKVLKYGYYHCTKRKNPKCSQGSIEIKEMEKQIDKRLSKTYISEEFKEWAISSLRELKNEDTGADETILLSQRKAYDSCLKKMNNLFQLKISPLNENGSLLSDEDYAKQKAELTQEKIRLEEILNDATTRVRKWLTIAEDAFEFACYSRGWLENGSQEEKGSILYKLSSNLTLKDKKLLIQAKKPLGCIENIVEGVREARASYEPSKYGLTMRNILDIFARNPIVLRELNNVRTECVRMAMSDSDYTDFSDFGKRRKVA